MNFTNKTEKEYRIVEAGLKAINLKVPVGVYIMENIVSICEKIAEDVPAKEIVNEFSLSCKPEAFSTIFKKTTGVSIRDIPTMTAFDKRRIRLKKLGYEENKIEEILEAVQPG